MKAHIVATALGALVIAAGPCLAQTDAAPKPVAPGSVRVTTKAPEPDKWNAQKNANGTQRIFKCKPLACSEPQTVTFTFSKSPARHPDPKALEKFAKEDLPKSIRAASAAREVLTDGAEKIETLMSQTTTLKSYPSVINESKISRGKSDAYIQIAIIFAGPVMVRVQSSSPDRELAKKALNDFIEIMELEEGPPLPPPRSKPPERSLGI